jgi:FkbM family methyltransferase
MTTSLCKDGVGHFGGCSYRFAYPEGKGPEDASRWSHVDESEVRDELWKVEPGDTVFDLGSAFGSYSLAALSAGAARVHCFNPSPYEQEILWDSLMLNGWQERAWLLTMGLWSRSGYLSDEDQVFLPDDGQSFKVTTLPDGKSTQHFPVMSLDSLALPAPSGRSIVKMDVEGAEVEVLKGARSFFSRIVPALVLIEKHRFKDDTLAERTDQEMAALGYRLVVDRPYHSVSHSLYVPNE